jgi:hypothetical protein
MRGGFYSGSIANSISDAASGVSNQVNASLARNDYGNNISDQANRIINTPKVTPYDMYVKNLQNTANGFTQANTSQLQSYINKSLAQPNIKTDTALQNKIMTTLGTAENNFLNSLK